MRYDWGMAYDQGPCHPLGWGGTFSVASRVRGNREFPLRAASWRLRSRSLAQPHRIGPHMLFTLSMDVHAPEAVITAGGELDIFTTRRLRERLHDALDMGCVRVLVDVAGVSFADASAMRVLSRFHTQLAEIGGSLEFIACSPQFLRLCRITGLDSVFGMRTGPALT